MSPTITLRMPSPADGTVRELYLKYLEREAPKELTTESVQSLLDAVGAQLAVFSELEVIFNNQLDKLGSKINKGAGSVNTMEAVQSIEYAFRAYWNEVTADFARLVAGR